MYPIRAKVRAIYQHERKSDQRDVLVLARIDRMDRAPLYRPIGRNHLSEQRVSDPRRATEFVSGNLLSRLQRALVLKVGVGEQRSREPV